MPQEPWTKTEKQHLAALYDTMNQRQAVKMFAVWSAENGNRRSYQEIRGQLKMIYAELLDVEKALVTVPELEVLLGISRSRLYRALRRYSVPLKQTPDGNYVDIKGLKELIRIKPRLFADVRVGGLVWLFGEYSHVPQWVKSHRCHGSGRPANLRVVTGDGRVKHFRSLKDAAKDLNVSVTTVIRLLKHETVLQGHRVERVN